MCKLLYQFDIFLTVKLTLHNIYRWPTVVIGLLREHVTTQDKKKKALCEAKEKALREAEKKDSHEAEKPGEKDSIAEPVLGLCKSRSNL